MAIRLFSDKPLPVLAMIYCQSNDREQLIVRILKKEQKKVEIFQHNVFENIFYKMWAILFMLHCDDSFWRTGGHVARWQFLWLIFKYPAMQPNL